MENEASNQGVPDALILPEGRLYFGYPVVPLKGPQTMEKKWTETLGQTLRASK